MYGRLTGLDSSVTLLSPSYINQPSYINHEVTQVRNPMRNNKMVSVILLAYFVLNCRVYLLGFLSGRL